MPAHCAVKGCWVGWPRDDLSFHKLPGRPSVRAAWLKALRLDGTQKSVYVCSRHFTPEDFVRPNRAGKEDGRARLRMSAVPTVLSPTLPSTSVDRDHDYLHLFQQPTSLATQPIEVQQALGAEHDHTYTLCKDEARKKLLESLEKEKTEKRRAQQESSKKSAQIRTLKACIEKLKSEAGKKEGVPASEPVMDSVDEDLYNFMRQEIDKTPVSHPERDKQ